MARNKDNIENLKWFQKLYVKYKLTIRRQDTYEERVAFQVTRMNVIVYTGAFAVLVIVLTSLFIAYTPLKEYIPGQTEHETREELYELKTRTDSIERVLNQKELYLISIKKVLSGGVIPEEAPIAQNDTKDYHKIELDYSREDSILRQQFENRDEYQLMDYSQANGEQYSSEGDILMENFFKPVSGYLTNSFDAGKGHFGVDIVPDGDNTVKATLPGTVIFSGWTVETGYVITIQHGKNLISAYKHNASLLKSQGEKVDAGDPIAISGESGELSSGPHLHFELWFNGSPADPEEYIMF
ncbi:MAG: M23 family metallopeptidase [Bacteroidota bacterium]